MCTFLQTGTGALERPIQDKLRETVSAADFGALGDDSGTTVDQWLFGGTYSRGAADLADLRAMSGIADLELTDTIDWAAITAAVKAAGPQPVRLAAGGNYRLSRTVVLIEDGGLVGIDGQFAIIKPAAGFAGDLIEVAPTLNNRRFHLCNLFLTGGGAHGLHCNSLKYINPQSRFENIHFSNFALDGFRNDGLQFQGTIIRNIQAEFCRKGIAFVGRAMINASVWELVRGSACSEHGILIENTNSSEEMPALTIINPRFEGNTGVGLEIVGAQVAVISPHFENNTGGCYRQRRTKNIINPRVTLIQPFFGPATNNLRTSGQGQLTIIGGDFRSSDILGTFMNAMVVGPVAPPGDNVPATFYSFHSAKPPTNNRPVASAVPKGSQHWDGTAKRPIWSDGTVWRYADGTAMP